MPCFVPMKYSKWRKQWDIQKKLNAPISSTSSICGACGGVNVNPTPMRGGWAGVVGPRSDLRAQRACLLFYRKSPPPELPMDRQAGRQDALSSNNVLLYDASGDELPAIYNKVVIEFPDSIVGLALLSEIWISKDLRVLLLKFTLNVTSLVSTLSNPLSKTPRPNELILSLVLYSLLKVWFKGDFINNKVKVK